eukprot:CAMPEP_0118862454 /NCGR_PEP_ID=MMETSP1163-20130328/7654_1 /TAXON_ID=124430 /ORGANISM="Phaeomonas parva, Strain CCMP2877" /LENGTH=285 /DNA_ID=CAMNT_0006796365 /DNA_START=186 /DNA_END=1043 /DNA_ORIENTATION=-
MQRSMRLALLLLGLGLAQQTAGLRLGLGRRAARLGRSLQPRSAGALRSEATTGFGFGPAQAQASPAWAALPSKGRRSRNTKLFAMRDGRDPGIFSRAASAVAGFLAKNGTTLFGVGFLWLIVTGRIFLLLDFMFWGVILFPLGTFVVNSIYRTLNAIKADCPVCGTTLNAQKNAFTRCANCDAILRAEGSELKAMGQGDGASFESIFDAFFGGQSFGGQPGGPQGGGFRSGSFGGPAGAPGAGPAGRAPGSVDVDASASKPKPKPKSSFKDDDGGDGEVVDVEVK